MSIEYTKKNNIIFTICESDIFWERRVRNTLYSCRIGFESENVNNSEAVYHHPINTVNYYYTHMYDEPK